MTLLRIYKCNMENKRNKNTIENTPVLKFLLIDIQNHEY